VPKKFLNQPGFSAKNTADFFINNAIYFIMIAIVIAVIAVEPRFFNIANLNMILNQASTRVIFALGIAGIIVIGGVDLSLGRHVGMAAMFSALFLQAPDFARRIIPGLPTLPLFVPILGVMILCAIVSMFTGWLTAKFRVAPFISSLGMQLVIFSGISVFFNTVGRSTPISGLDPRFSRFAQGFFTLGGGVRINFIIFYALACAIIVWFIWNKTILGKNMFAIGGNTQAAQVSGVNVKRNIIIVYALAGLLYGFGGALEGARTGSVTNALGMGYELDAIAACVIGGVSMRGGKGTVAGVVVGAILFQVVTFALIFIGINPDYQFFVLGAIIITTVIIDTRKEYRRAT